MASTMRMRRHVSGFTNADARVRAATSGPDAAGGGGGGGSPRGAALAPAAGGESRPGSTRGGAGGSGGGGSGSGGSGAASSGGGMTTLPPALRSEGSVTVASDAFYRVLMGRDAVATPLRPTPSPSPSSSSRLSIAWGSSGGGGGGGGGGGAAGSVDSGTILVAERGILPVDAGRRTRSKGAPAVAGSGSLPSPATAVLGSPLRSASVAAGGASASAAGPRRASAAIEEAGVDPTSRVATAEEAMEALRQGGSIRRAAKTFYAMDTDHDGMLAPEQLQVALATNKLVLSTKEIGRLMKMVDDNGDGTVQINEFLRHCHSAVGVRPPRASALQEPAPGVSSDGGDRAALAAPPVRRAVQDITAAWPELADALPRQKSRVVGIFEALDRDQDRYVSKDALRDYLRGRVLAALPPDRTPSSALDATIHERAASSFGLLPGPRGTPDVMDPAGPALHTAALPFDAAVQRLVDLADTNHDGHVDAADVAVLADALHDDDQWGARPTRRSMAATATAAAAASDSGKWEAPERLPPLCESTSLPFLPSMLPRTTDDRPARWHPAVLAAHGGVPPNAGVGTADGLPSTATGSASTASPRAGSSGRAASAVTPGLRAVLREAATRPLSYHSTAHGSAIPMGGGVSGTTSSLRAPAPVPYWMEYNDDVVVPGADAPAYATSSDRFRTTAEEAAAAGLTSEVTAARLSLGHSRAALAMERKAQRLARITESYEIDRERAEARTAAAQEARRIRAQAQRSVVGDYITGTVETVLHTSKRTFKPEDTPGLRPVRGVAPVPFRLVYDLTATGGVAAPGAAR